MFLFHGQNVDKCIEAGDTFASEELQQFLVAVAWLNDVDNVVSLWPRDAADCGTSQFGDKGVTRVDKIQ